MAKYPPGTVGMLTGDLTRYAWAMMSLRRLQLPEETQLTWVAGHWISYAVNQIIAQMRPQDAWICLLTDDNPCPADMLLRLLDHHLPLVAPLVCLRQPPYRPSLYRQGEDGLFRGLTWEELAGKQGLMPVDSFGGPGVVIRREVLEAVGQPFFENMPGPVGREAPHEDLYTFTKCRQAGFQPMVDLDCRLGHCIPAIVTPECAPELGQWGVSFWSYEPIGTVWAVPPAPDSG